MAFKIQNIPIVVQQIEDSAVHIQGTTVTQNNMSPTPIVVRKRRGARVSGGGGEASLYALYRGESTPVKAPAVGATLDYLSFGELEIGADGTFYYVYYLGDAHNTSFDGSDSIQLIKSTDLGATWGAPVQVTAGTNLFNTTDPSIFITPGGRLMVTYMKRDSTTRTAYKRFSTDGLTGATWGAESLFTAEQDTGGVLEGQHLQGPGRAIAGANGTDILKPMFGTNTPGVNGRQGIMYKSTDDGDTFTRLSLIWDKSAVNGEEPCVCRLPSGRILATQRSDPDDLTRLFYSDDDAVTWTGPVEVGDGYPGIGKPAIACSNNMVTIMSRGYSGAGLGGRTVMVSTTDISTGLTGWGDASYVDERTGIYMYGGVKFYDGKFYFIYSAEALGVATPGISGPTAIVMTPYVESETTVTEGAQYEVELRSTLDTAGGNGAILPSSTMKDLLNSLILDRGKGNGWWDEFEMFKVFYLGGDADLATFTLYDLKKSIERLGVLTVAPTYDGNTWDFNGSTHVIDSGFQPSGGVIYTQNDACAVCYIDQNVAEANSVTFGVSNGNFSTLTKGPYLFPRNATDQARYAINDDTNSLVSGITDTTGLWHLQRRASDDKRLWKGGVQIDQNTAASVTRVATNVRLGAMRFANATNYYSTRAISLIGFGASLSGGEVQFNTDIEWFRAQVDLL